jgi:hypothetical protein
MTKSDFKLGRKRCQVYRLHGEPRRWRRLTPRSVAIFESWLRASPELFRAERGRGRVVSLRSPAFGRPAGSRLPGWIADVLQASPLDEVDEIKSWHAAHRLACKVAEVRRGLWPPSYRKRDWTEGTLASDRPLFVYLYARLNRAAGIFQVLASKPVTRARLLSDCILPVPATESDTFPLAYRAVPARMSPASFHTSLARGVAGRDLPSLIDLAHELWPDFALPFE